MPLIIGQTGKNAGAGLLERLRPLAWGTPSNFQERFPSVSQIRNDYADPAFVINCNDFDEPQYPERAPCRLLPKVDESEVFPANLVLLWRGKLV